MKLDTNSTEVRLKHDSPMNTKPDNTMGYPLDGNGTKIKGSFDPRSAGWGQNTPNGTFQSNGTTVPLKNKPMQAYDNISLSDRASESKRKNY